MPQMAPLLWLLLFIYFLMSLLIFLMMNYFIKPFNKILFLKNPLTSLYKPWKL
uniref:ATP synthase F0 subunit 8 n=1 Tax=Tzotzilthelphusa villarosalensis TaxID=2761036 RepID=UPI00286C73DE|nr:ATP synthase F0 subunit 8 [Tzotzilthelphusa villarosalensis]WKW91710.1 ATP synthase F0 subunit 8 [Tzotzilthelphusa villarosalensis]